MDLANYQARSQLTSQLPLKEEGHALPALLGLASEIGSILDVYKRHLRDGTDLSDSNAFFKEELGDLLWYTAAVATACGLNLEEIAAQNLQKTRNLYPASGGDADFEGLPVLDESYPAHERFPRRMTFEFKDAAGDPPKASIRLIEAAPNVFPNGPQTINGKPCGFSVGEGVGAQLTDNSTRPDDYRFHDAIHLGFLAVLGWSPTVRSLLHLKRRSNPLVDDAEDGARAVYAEEGLSAVLAQLAHVRHEFEVEASVDSITLMVVRAASQGLEVSRMPLWPWRRAINQAFTAMRAVAANGGGFVVADLDARTLRFSKTLDGTK